MFFTRDEATFLVTYLHGADATPEAFIGELWVEDHSGAFVVAVEDGASCPFLSGGRCSVHPVRPEQCRTYPFWPETLASPGSWQVESRHCEGISATGELYDLTRIARILNGQAT